MYADDMVLFSETIDDPQPMLNTLSWYTKDSNLEVNIEKTKIVICSNYGVVKDYECWVYNGVEIDISNEFGYLGIV